MEPVITWSLGTLVGALIGSYIGGYLRKKGENLATHEDIDKLLQQVRAVTTATKQIEAKISSDLWDRQKQWEMRRDVLFTAAKRVAELDDALLSYNSAVQTRARSEDGDEIWVPVIAQEVRRWRDAMTQFDEVRLLVGIVCGEELRHALDEVAIVTNKIVIDGTTKGKWELYEKCQIDLGRKLASVKAAMRAEMGIDPTA